MRKKCDREKVLIFEAEGQEFAKFLRSLEQSIQTVKVRSEQFLVTECFFNLLLEVFHIKLEKNIGIQKRIGKVRKSFC